MPGLENTNLHIKTTMQAEQGIGEKVHDHTISSFQSIIEPTTSKKKRSFVQMYQI